MILQLKKEQCILDNIPQSLFSQQWLQRCSGRDDLALLNTVMCTESLVSEVQNRTSSYKLCLRTWFSGSKWNKFENSYIYLYSRAKWKVKFILEWYSNVTYMIWLLLPWCKIISSKLLFILYLFWITNGYLRSTVPVQIKSAPNPVC